MQRKEFAAAEGRADSYLVKRLNKTVPRVCVKRIVFISGKRETDRGVNIHEV